MEKFNAGEFSTEELNAQWQHPPEKIVAKNFKHMCEKFLKAKCWSSQKVNTSGNYLPYQDPRMQEHLDIQNSCVNILLYITSAVSCCVSRGQIKPCQDIERFRVQGTFF